MSSLVNEEPMSINRGNIDAGSLGGAGEDLAPSSCIFNPYRPY